MKNLRSLKVVDLMAIMQVPESQVIEWIDHGEIHAHCVADDYVRGETTSVKPIDWRFTHEQVREFLARCQDRREGLAELVNANPRKVSEYEAAARLNCCADEFFEMAMSVVEREFKLVPKDAA